MLNSYVVCDDDVREVLHSYFKSDAVKSIADDAVNIKRKNKYESLIRDMLVTGVDYKLIPRDDKKLISRGFLVNDGSVNLLMHNMTLRGVRHSSFLNTVAFDVTTNHLMLYGTLIKMFIDTEYFLFRPESKVQYKTGELSPDSYSPFTLDQVQKQGNFTIIAQNCKITGKVFTKLDDPSVTLGHSTFRLDDCKFDVEVSTPGLGIAPVMAPYFHGEKSAELVRLISLVFGDLLTLRMQLIIYFFVLIKDIIKKGDIIRLSSKQETLLKYSAEFMNAVVKNADNTIIAKKMSTIELPDLNIQINDDKVKGQAQKFQVVLTNIVMNGLDSMYSANSGGPHLLQTVKISEAIMFHTLTVKGQITLEENKVRSNYEYFVEIKDTRLDVSIDFGANSGAPVIVEHIRFVGWKTLDLSISVLEPSNEEREMLNALIIAHLSQELPAILEPLLKESLQNAIAAMPGQQESTTPIQTNSETQPNIEEKYRPEVVTEYTDIEGEKKKNDEDEDFDEDTSKTAEKQGALVKLPKKYIDENVIGDPRLVVTPRGIISAEEDHINIVRRHNPN